MIGLLDINFLVALTWPSHLHHAQAQSWFQENSLLGWATCPITQCGFIRVSSNHKIIPDAVPPKDALAVLKELTSLKGHTFWPDTLSCLDEQQFPTALLIGHRQVTDAYLLGLAVKNNGRLITFDKGIRSLISKESKAAKSLCVVEV